MHPEARCARPRPLRERKLRRSLAFTAAAFALLATFGASERTASADVSSWLSAGGGYGVQRSDSRGYYDRATALSFSVGVGSTPLSSVVVGGLVRSTTYFSLGTDIDLSLRIASGSFARGQWGLAFDIGPGWRTWKKNQDYGRFPLHAMIVGGAPWGVQLGLGVDALNLEGAPAALGGVALLEIDLLRLTVMRQGSTDRWWENPAPAGGRMR
jgi:hypothetical protein